MSFLVWVGRGGRVAKSRWHMCRFLSVGRGGRGAKSRGHMCRFLWVGRSGRVTKSPRCMCRFWWVDRCWRLAGASAGWARRILRVRRISLDVRLTFDSIEKSMDLPWIFNICSADVRSIFYKCSIDVRGELATGRPLVLMENGRFPSFGFNTTDITFVPWADPDRSTIR